MSWAHFGAGAVAGALVGVLASQASQATTAPRARRVSEAEGARAMRAVDSVFAAAARGESLAVVEREARDAMRVASGVPGLRWRSADDLAGAAVLYAARRERGGRGGRR